MLRNAKTTFLRCIDNVGLIKDRIKQGSLQTLALAQVHNLHND